MIKTEKLRNAKVIPYTGKNPTVNKVVEGMCPVCGKKKRIYLNKDEQNIYIADKEGNKLFPSLCECDEVEEKEIIQNKVQIKLGKTSIETLLNQSGFGEKEIQLINIPFIKDQYNGASQDTLVKWVANFRSRSKENFLLIGPTGRGKTFLAIKTGMVLIKRNISVYYVNVKKYMESIRASNDTRVIEANKKKAATCSVLILDDLGAEKLTEFVQLELYELLDKRSQYKATIITTNLEPQQIKDRYGERTYSRLTMATPKENIIIMKGPPWPR